MGILVLCIAASYLLGSTPFALLVGKLKGVDIRKVGSGNIGATNLTRTLGRRWGIAAFCLDFLKGWLPAFVAGDVVGDALGGAAAALRPEHCRIFCGLAAVLGHVFPIFLRFRGGKGVATSFGVLAGVMPLATLAAGVAWIVIFKTTRFVSLSSIVAAALFPIAFPVERLLSSSSMDPAVFWAYEGLALAASSLILVRHRENIVRLIARKEHRF